MLPADLQNLAGQSDEDTGRGHISHSSIGTLLACQKRYELSYEQGLELITRPAPLTMGSAFHHALETGDPILGANMLDRETFSQEEYDKLLIDKATVASAAMAYAKRWSGDDWDKNLNEKREVEYRIRIRNPAWWPESGHIKHHSRYDLLGYADGVIDHGDHLELIEDKFVGQISKDAVRRVALDRQVGLESYALWRITGKPVRQVRYRFTKKPSIKQKQKETVDEFMQRLQADYLERLDFYTHEEQTFRSDADLELIERELWAWAGMFDEAKARGFFPRNTSSCGDYGGCAYIPICGGDPDATSLYRQKAR